MSGREQSREVRTVVKATSYVALENIPSLLLYRSVTDQRQRPADGWAGGRSTVLGVGRLWRCVADVDAVRIGQTPLRWSLGLRFHTFSFPEPCRILLSSFDFCGHK